MFFVLKCQLSHYPFFLIESFIFNSEKTYVEVEIRNGLRNQNFSRPRQNITTKYNLHIGLVIEDAVINSHLSQKFTGTILYIIEEGTEDANANASLRNLPKLSE
jgi:hypothetical protein